MTTSTVRPQLTHMGINVYDIAAMEAFYTEVLGLVVTDRGVGTTFKAQLVFMSSSPYSHHQVVIASGRDPNSPQTSINQISFKVEDLEQLTVARPRSPAPWRVGILAEVAADLPEGRCRVRCGVLIRPPTRRAAGFARRSARVCLI